MKIEFTKMHGAGNDYIYVNCLSGELPDPAAAAVAMSPRHFSVGADGLVMICSSEVADAKMRMFNADGSEGKMCGNAIRCVGKYLYDNNLVQKKDLTIETLSGIKTLRLHEGENGKIVSVSVGMGKASFDPRDIPAVSECELIRAPYTVAGTEYRITAVSMGNPHCVVFTDDTDSLALESIGRKFEVDPLFPEHVNTEFVQVLSPRTLKMRVWERGSGETWACGTGACATVAAAVRCGICPAGEEIEVRLIGGTLRITCAQDYSITMKGGAEAAYDGVFEL